MTNSMNFELLFGLGRARNFPHAQVFSSLDTSRDCSTDCITNATLGIVLFDYQDRSSDFFDVLA